LDHISDLTAGWKIQLFNLLSQLQLSFFQTVNLIVQIYQFQPCPFIPTITYFYFIFFHLLLIATLISIFGSVLVNFTIELFQIIFELQISNFQILLLKKDIDILLDSLPIDLALLLKRIKFVILYTDFRVLNIMHRYWLSHSINILPKIRILHTNFVNHHIIVFHIRCARTV